MPRALTAIILIDSRIVYNMYNGNASRLILQALYRATVVYFVSFTF